MSSCVPPTTRYLKTKDGTYTRLQKQIILQGKDNDAMRIFEINHALDSVLLRQKSAIINLKRNSDINHKLAKRLEITMINEMGVGIAAPQVGILKQMICVQRFDKEGFTNEIYINPVITRYSEEKQNCREGCLSIPGRSDTTQIRALTIELSYQNVKGEKVEETITGFTAVIFQHEIDHLNGILYIDHLRQEMKD